jgi:hypothetical protein
MFSFSIKPMYHAVKANGWTSLILASQKGLVAGDNDLTRSSIQQRYSVKMDEYMLDYWLVNAAIHVHKLYLELRSVLCYYYD